MAKTLHSNNITFIDLTDVKKREVYIASNLPTTQIYDVNISSHSPNWENTPLTLIPTVLADGKNITDQLSAADITWYRQIGTNTKTRIVSGTKSLTISENELTDEQLGLASGVISYICSVPNDNGTPSEAQITFARVDTGRNGTNGNNAPTVKAQYSEDGSTSWTATLDASVHQYIRLSYDNGTTWTSAIKIAGKDGKSVSIKGTATSKSVVSGTSYYTLVYNSATITGASVGDAYLLDGNLYVCVDSRNGNDYFMDVGQIQGPQGQKGDSYYLFIRYANDTNGTGISSSPSGKTYIGFYRSSVNQVPTDVSSATWNWAKFVGDNAKTITLTGDAQAFKVDKSNVVSPATIKVTAQVENTSVTSWTYSTDGGTTFASSVTGISRSGNVVTISGSEMTTNSITIKASDGTRNDMFTVYKVSDGSDGKPGEEGAPAYTAFLTNESIAFVANSSGEIDKTTVFSNVVVYKGTEKVIPTLGPITKIPDGMTITSSTLSDLNELKLTMDITDKATLGSITSNYGSINIPITAPMAVNLKLNWSKINSGAKGDMGDTGVGIKSTTVAYGVSDSASTRPSDNSWQSTIPTVAEGKYLWTRTIIDYTDDTMADTVTYTYAKQGVKGDIGSSGTSVTVDKIEYQAGTSAVTAPTGTWSNGVVSVAEGGYLWTKTTFSDGKVAYGVAKQGAKGDTGRGVTSIVEQYYQSTSATSQSGGSWSSTVPTWVDGKYIWTRSVVTYTDTTTSTTSPVCITGQKGATGSTGASGVGVSSVDVWYYQSSSATSLNGGSWATTAPTWVDGKYVWTKTITTYTDATTDETSAVCITGQKGSQGIQGPKGNDGQQYYTWVKYADTPTSGMSDNPDGKAYIGLAYNKTTSTESSTYSDYMWSLIKGETGAVGPKGNDGQQYYTWIKYADNASGANMSDSPSGKSYIGLAYNKTTSTESNTASDYTWALFKGDKGDTGRGIRTVAEYYLATSSSSGVTTSTSGWTTTIQTITVDKKYLWNYELITYTDGDTSTTTPVIIGVFGNTGATGSTGATGKGIKSVIEYYLATTSSSGVTTSASGWTTTMQTLTATNKYLWNYELITYTDDSKATINPVIIGVYGDKGNTGDKGADAYTVILTNESHIFAGNVSSAIAANTTTQVLAYKGSTAQSVTIVSVDGKTASASSTATSITGLSFSCSALSGTSPTITFVCTTSFVSPSGTIPIVLTVDGVTITKMFTYSIAFKGATGGTGSSGASATSYWLISSASVIQKTATGTIAVTPSTLTFTGKSQTGTTTPTDYACRWIIAYSTDGTNYTDLYTSTTNETSKSITVATTYKTIRARMYLAGGTTTLLDEQIVPIVSDGAKGATGDSSVTFQIYAPNGYLLSNELESLTLQTVAYSGSTAITSATYVWSYQENDAWVNISNATKSSLTLTKNDVIKSKTYRCAMTYKNTVYYATATVQDTTDIYDVMICVSDNINPLTGIYYWVVYALLYSEQGEADALLGPISTNAPTTPVSGDYWYAVDAASQTVTLKQYNGSSWVASTDKQAYAYDWRQIVDGTQQQAIGNTDKVQIISCNNFTSSATFQCIVTDTDGSKLARCNIHLTDTSDPIVSDTAPVGVKDGQLWMQTQTDGTFLLYIWDASASIWKQLNADTKNVVHTTKPSSYKAGDLWVVESNTAISGYTKGTLLQSNATSTTFAAAHWTPSLKYETELSEVQNALKAYKQYMSVDDKGLHMQAKAADGTLSPFQALFTNTRLSFYQDDLEVAYISDNKLNIYEASIDVLSVEKKIQLQKFEWAIESNGSMSLIVNY